MNTHPFDYNFDGVLIGKNHPKGTKDELGREIRDNKGWVDGGDTCQRMGMYHAGLEAYKMIYGQAKFDKFVKEHGFLNYSDSAWKLSLLRLECKDQPGVYKRHDDTDFWYSDCDRMSRDQSFPLVAAMGFKRATSALWRFFKAHLGRGMLLTTNSRRNGSTALNHGQKFNRNAEPLSEWEKKVLDEKIPMAPVKKGYRNYNWKLPDITGPSFWVLYIRGFRIWLLYPLLCILDLEFLINSLIIKYNKDDNDTINHSVECIHTSLIMPTPITWFTNKYINSAKDLNRRSNIYFNRSGEPYFIDYLYRILLDKLLG